MTPEDTILGNKTHNASPFFAFDQCVMTNLQLILITVIIDTVKHTFESAPGPCCESALVLCEKSMSKK